MIDDRFPSFETTSSSPRILSGFPSRRMQPAAGTGRSSRFVTQSHALGAPSANPGALVIAAAIAVALFVIGRRLSV